MIKEWEFEGKDQLESTILIGKDKIAASTSNSYGVIDARTGEPVWMKSFADPLFGASLVYDGNNLYALIGKGSIVACDPQTGAKRWSIPMSGYATSPALYSGKMFMSLRAGELSSIDLRTHKVLWTHRLFSPAVPGASQESEQNVVIAPQVLGNVVVAGQGDFITAFNATTGKSLWQHHVPVKKDDVGSHSVESLCSDGKYLYRLIAGGAVNAFDLQTGRARWHWEQPYQGSNYTASGRIGNVLITVADDGFVRGLDFSSGKSLWARELDKGENISLSAPLLTQGTNVLIADQKNLHHIDLSNGKVQWSWNLDQDPLSPIACYQIGNRLVIASNCSLLCFRPGAPPTLPTDHSERLAQARRLADQFIAASRGDGKYSSRTSDIKRALLKFDAEAFEALLPYLESSAMAAVDTLTDKERGRDRFEDYSTFSNIVDAAAMAMHSKNTAQTQSILTLLSHVPRAYPNGSERADDSVRSELVKLLAEHGNEEMVLPVMIEEVNVFNGENTLNGSYAALDMLCHSHDPRAVHYLIEQLANPDGNAQVRSAAYCCLAETGDKEGVAAVLAIRNQPTGPLPTFRTLMNLDKFPTAVSAKDTDSPQKMLAVRADAKGVVWGLFTSPVLGSWGDLWIVPRKADGYWGNPIFTGLDTTADEAFSSEKTRKPFMYAGKTLKQLVSSGIWVTKLAHNPDLLRDTDGDGWTDLVEKRLGTNRKRVDTDGDGVRDSQSRCPCGGRAPRGDAEEILAAAFDARVRFTAERLPVPFFVVFPKGTAPFRMTGYNGIIISPCDSKAETTLADLYGEGVGIVSFMVSSGAISNPEINRREASGSASDLIVWNTARTEATVGIRIYYGGRNGTVYEMRLRKIEGKWIVVGSRMTIIS